jgi:glycosyltransferase involved in cell wall biosynthesis
MLEGDAGLLVPVGDAEGLGDATCRLLEDEALRRRVVAGATRRLEGFTDRAMARGTHAVYASVMRASTA